MNIFILDRDPAVAARYPPVDNCVVSCTIAFFFRRTHNG